MTIEEVINNPDLLEVARQAIEDQLIWRRDAHISVPRNNGLTVKLPDGFPSSIIRMSNEEALVIGLRAILAMEHVPE